MASNGADTLTGEGAHRDVVNLLRKRAEEDYRTGALDEADIAWEELAERDPDQLTMASIFRARIAWRQNRPDDAVENYRTVLDERLDHEEALRYVLRHSLDNGGRGEVESLRDRLKTEQPESKAWHIAEALIAEAEGREEDMIAILERAVENWQDKALYLQFVDSLRMTGKVERALTAVEQALEHFPDSVRLNNRRALVLKLLLMEKADNSKWRGKLVDKALEIKELYTVRDFADLAIHCANGEGFADAERLLAETGGEGEADIRVIQARAHLEFRRGNYAEAERYWRELGENDASAGRIVLLHRARIANAENRTEDAAAFYSAVIEDHGPEEEPVRFLVQNALTKGDTEAAREIHAMFAKQMPQSDAIAALSAEIDFAGGDKEGAIETLEEDIEAGAADANTHLQFVDLLIMGGHERVEIMAALDRARAAFPADKRLVSRKVVQIKLGVEEAARDHDIAALKTFEAEIDGFGGALKAADYALLIGAMTTAEKFEKAEELIARAEKECGENPAFTHAQALVHYRCGDLDEADRMWGTLGEEVPSRWRAATTHRARIAINQGRKSDAANLFEQLWQKHSDHDEAAQFLIRDRAGANDLPGARRLRDSIAEKRPDSKLLASCEAIIAASGNDNDGALTILNEAIGRWPDQIDLHLQFIDVQRNTGRFDEALAAIGMAIETFPGDRRPLDRKLAIYSVTADNDEMLDFLDELLGEYPGRVDLHVRKARTLANAGARHEALDACRAGLTVAPAEVDLWRLGISSLLNLNEPGQAAEFLAQGLQNFAETDADSLVARAELFYAGDLYEEACKAANRALALDPGHQQAMLYLARATEAVGDWPKALGTYRAAGFEPEERARFAADMGRLAKAVAYVEDRLGMPEIASPNPMQAMADWFSDLFGSKKAPDVARLYPHAIFEAAAAGAQPQAYVPEPVVMHVTSSLGPGGAERQLTIGAIQQSRRETGLNPIVAAISLSEIGSRNFFHADLQAAGVDVVALGETLEDGAIRDFIADHPEHRAQLAVLATLPIDALRLAVPLYCEIVRRRPAVLHLWQDTTAVSGGLAGCLAGVPRMIFSTRSTRPIERQRARPYLHAGFKALLSLPHADMINNSRNGARDYEDWFGDPEMKIETVYNGYDFEAMRGRADPGEAAQIRRNLGCGDDEILLGGVMRLSAEKRPELWLEAAIALMGMRADAKAVLVGAGPMAPTLDQRIREAGLEDRIVMAGARSPVEPWMRAMDLLLLSSFTEGLPNVLIEAQALGTPVAATDVGGASETFVAGETGVLVPGDASGPEIAAALFPLFDDRAALAAMGEAGIGWTDQTFSIEATLDALDRVYQAKPPTP